MAEYDWNQAYLNKPRFLSKLESAEILGVALKYAKVWLGFLISLNKNKHDWISLEYAIICLIYNIKDTVKLL